MWAFGICLVGQILNAIDSRVPHDNIGPGAQLSNGGRIKIEDPASVRRSTEGLSGVGDRFPHLHWETYLILSRRRNVMVHGLVSCIVESEFGGGAYPERSFMGLRHG